MSLGHNDHEHPVICDYMDDRLTVPRCRRITFGRRAFSVAAAAPTVWNSLPTEFRDLSVGFVDFRRTLNTILFARYLYIRRSGAVMHHFALYK